MPRTASSLFSILDPTLSGYETKSPTRDSLRLCPENVTTDSSIVELSSGSGTSLGLFPPTRSISLPDIIPLGKRAWSPLRGSRHPTSFPSDSSRTAPLSSSGLRPPIEVPSCPWTVSPLIDTSVSVPTGVYSPHLRPIPKMEPCRLPDDRESPQSSEYLPPPLQNPIKDPTPQLGLTSHQATWGCTFPFLDEPLCSDPHLSTRLPRPDSLYPEGFHCRAGALHTAFCVAPPLPSNPRGTVPVPPPSLFNMGGNTTLSTSSPSIDPLYIGTKVQAQVS